MGTGGARPASRIWCTDGSHLLCTPRMNKWTFMSPNIAPLPPITPICDLEHTCPAPTRCPKGSTSRGPRPTRSTVHAGVFRLQPPPAQVKYGHGTSECSSAVSKSGLIHNDQEVGGSPNLRPGSLEIVFHASAAAVHVRRSNGVRAADAWSRIVDGLPNSVTLPAPRPFGQQPLLRYIEP